MATTSTTDKATARASADEKLTTLYQLEMAVTRSRDAVDELRDELTSTIDDFKAAVEDADYQNAEQVETAINDAIEGNELIHWEIVTTNPTASNFKGAQNTIYFYYNSATNHYDMYALLGKTMELIDDTVVDLDDYPTWSDMDDAITAALTEGCVIATDEEFEAMLEGVWG